MVERKVQRTEVINRRTVRNRRTGILQDDGRTEYNPNRMSVQLVAADDSRLKSENLMDLIGGEFNVSMDSDDIDVLASGLGAPDQEALEKAAIEAQKERDAAEAQARAKAEELTKMQQEEVKRIEMERWKKEAAKKAAEKAAQQAVKKQ